ncbi:hypothetical protein HPP92_007928 [Vanilla planifolia]|uniref:EGF-like domain-containing protein n=1 Tax=Vanilla planifolia TaxID=51239 RepID=A0A835RNB9_VANPL|nr:hypothetical protein HPP92_007928 [Vanilla planifolia]
MTSNPNVAKMVHDSWMGKTSNAPSPRWWRKSAYCGKGICKVSDNHSLGFVCQCNEGWSQYHIEDYFRFLPCLIPNCSINYSCSNSSIPPAAAPLPSPPDKLSLFNPCTWSFCGGGECVRSSTFEHRCECKPNYSNLLNISSFPCYKDCSIGADCKNLGISISNSSSSFSSSSSSISPTVTGNESSSSGQDQAWMHYACKGYDCCLAS